VANSKPDGYTLLIDIVTRPTLMQAVNSGEPETIDIQKAFVAVGPIGSSPMIMNVSPSLRGEGFRFLRAKDQV